jgi:uncharacterized protein YegP (UPF0339 family)
MKYQIKKSKDNQFFFVLIARNGEIVATSETYQTQQGALKGIRAVKRSLFAPVIRYSI